MNGAELLARMLAAYEVDYVFGVPGDTNVSFYEALDKLGGAVQHVLTRDERHAGYMADAYARITNRPGVVEVPSGGGPMYALPAVAEAHESAVPVILLSFDMPLLGEGRGVITQFADLVRLLEPVTKASIPIKRAVKIPEIVRRAFRIATSGRPGAVNIVIPEDVLHEEVDLRQVSLHAENACKTFPAYAPRAGHNDVLELQRMLAEARRPLIVAGGGVNRARAGEALTELAERLRIPVVTTITGQGSIPDPHELSIGIVGDNGFHPHANRAMEEADLLVYLGSRMGSVVTIGGTFPPPRQDRRIVQVEIGPELLGNAGRNTLNIHADARALLEQLSELPPPRAMQTDPKWVATLNDWRLKFWEEANRQLQAARRAGGALRPLVIMEALNRRLKEPHVLLADPGTSTVYLNRFIRLEHPQSRVIIPRAYGALGYALPAVVGSWFARPGIRPIGLFGDGSFGMSVGELETIVRLDVPAILLHFNNSSFGWIKALQKSRRLEHTLSVDFSQQNAARIAEAFGLRAMRVQTVQEVEAAFDAAFAHRGPVFLDLVVESVADVIPPVYKWLHDAGMSPLEVDGRALTMS
ncbi:MAG TPA: thiamine pyrophosphate-binding protein [Steroidobacter sp.]